MISFLRVNSNDMFTLTLSSIHIFSVWYTYCSKIMILHPQLNFCNSETSSLCFLCKTTETNDLCFVTLAYILMLGFKMIFWRHYLKGDMFKLLLDTFMHLKNHPKFASFCYFYKTACAANECFCLILENWCAQNKHFCLNCKNKCSWKAISLELAKINKTICISFFMKRKFGQIHLFMNICNDCYR